MTDASADMSSSFNVGYWHEWDCPIGSLPSVLATALANAGWTRAEEGYDTMSPAGYASIYYLLEMGYANIARADGSSSSSNFTYILARIAAAYDAVNHRPDQTANGGRSYFRMIRDNDHSASTTVKYDIKGWITSTCCLLWIHSEAVSGGDKRQIIFCGEMDKIGEAANTVMLLVYEYLSEVGTKSMAQSYTDPALETHFIHCLGDGHAYIPYTSGYGASYFDDNVRPQTVIAWRYTGSGSQQQYNLGWEIPSDVLRGARFTGEEDDEDTFADGSMTFVKVSRPSFSREGGVWLVKDSYNAAEDAGQWWFRKA